VIEIADVLGLQADIGREVAVSEWFDVSQSRIDRFADATEDRQWIHVDAERAAKESPYGTPIAHGFLTLSLVPILLRSAFDFPGVRLAVNYGLNRVRFVSPVPAGARIRGRFTPLSVAPRDDGADVTWAVTIEREHGDKPCCVAECIVRYYLPT
jgi:acyl dehydratase